MGEKKNTDNRALYRMYRSKSLDEIVGQEHVTKTLKSAIDSGKISHAYLFTGPRGVGKTSIARILAHEINQIPYTDDSTHLDIIEIDAASNRRIDDIRDLREKVNLVPVNAKYKVYIIDEVHMLTSESFNALLKTLEEPPAHVIFILATTEVHKLPATIISRTQRHVFRTVPKQKVTQHLAQIAKDESIDIENEALELLAEYGEGSFRDSISMLDQMRHMPSPITRESVEELLGIAPTIHVSELLECAEAGDISKIIDQLSDLSDQGVEPLTVAKQIITLLKSDQISSAKLALMKSCVQIQASQNPALSLEIALIEFALSSSNQTDQEPQKKPETVAKSSNRPKTVEAATAGAKPEEPVTAKPATQEPEPIKTEVKKENPSNESIKSATKRTKVASSDTLEEFWSDILAEIKEANSSLYTIMRLTHPRLEGEKLILSFQFPFHQKRAQDAKSTALIAQIVSNHLNFQPLIETKVDSSLARKPVTQAPAASVADPAHASLITQVQDIMGGGEIVDAQLN